MSLVICPNCRGSQKINLMGGMGQEDCKYCKGVGKIPAEPKEEKKEEVKTESETVIEKGEKDGKGKKAT